MWYEALPPAVIVFVLLNIPDRFCSLTNKLVLGNTYRRDIGKPWMQRYYARDWELTGNPYKAQGLESLSDEPTIGGINWQKYNRFSK
ncbi:uncharacterized protein LOC126905875 [Daktulosphaira vitifoliae]|uniref:uncharacterized protein LOC126905875 n=1 Tax=Daktulosphaira vitifoliae TaxID=58002 RepID=UPI0021A9E7C9|nr:uncharacterized protein LOC126905875 [Daktulosphaira vitifoliae]